MITKTPFDIFSRKTFKILPNVYILTNVSVFSHFLKLLKLSKASFFLFQHHLAITFKRHFWKQFAHLGRDNTSFDDTT